MEGNDSNIRRRAVLSAFGGIATTGAVSGSAKANGSQQRHTATSHDAVSIDFDEQSPTVDRETAVDRSPITSNVGSIQSSPPDENLTYVGG